MPDPRDIVEIGQPEPGRAQSSGTVPTSSHARAETNVEATGKPFLSLHYVCAGAYTRAYQSPTGDAYLGRCPRCAKATRFAIGPGGTSERAFRIDCR